MQRELPFGTNPRIRVRKASTPARVLSVTARHVAPCSRELSLRILQSLAHNTADIVIRCEWCIPVRFSRPEGRAEMSGSNCASCSKPGLGRGLYLVMLAIALVASAPRNAAADEGGVSFWIPGLFGSLAAVPQQPGWSAATIYYHTSVSGGGDVALAREITTGRIPTNLTATVNANLKADADLAVIYPTYVFKTPVLGGQASIGMLGVAGRESASLAGTVTGALSTPFGAIPFSRSDALSDTDVGFGDLVPIASLRWHSGVHNYMTYITGDIPVGSYNRTSLANLGIGHGAVDAGGGYTYFNQKAGHEFSAVLGFTYNVENPYTHYQNGVDMHLDWGASQFLTK